MLRPLALPGRRFPGIVAGAALAAAVLAVYPTLLAQRPGGGRGEGGEGNDRWVGTWATAGMARPPQGGHAPPSVVQSSLDFNNQTLRQIVHVSLGGERVRVVFSNTFGTVPLAIGAAHLALRDREATIVPGSGRPLTFSGKSSSTIPAGALLVSDSVTLTVPPLSDLAVDIYLPGDTATTHSPATIHASGFQTNYVSAPGNHAGAVNLPVQATTGFLRGGIPTSTWFYLARVEVMAPQQSGAIVAIGDSITDGHQSGIDTNNRWPDHLARRLQKANIRMGVLNVGIGGNRVLTDNVALLPTDSAPPNAQARFDRDVLAQTGVTHVIVLEGINDIGGARENPSPGAADLIDGHRQLIERAHARGLKIYGATLTPFEGAAYWTREGEAKRRELNQWIRTSKMYDAVFDFDAVTRDPNQPTRFLPQYDPGDHLHPNAAGYQAMADAIDLALFKAVPGIAPR